MKIRAHIGGFCNKPMCMGAITIFVIKDGMCGWGGGAHVLYRPVALRGLNGSITLIFFT